ncbi:MAG: type 1 glutamine amidotransferase [Rhodothermales bacterium]
MLQKLRYLLLQVRNLNDPMRMQEVGCFARTLHTAPRHIRAFDLLSGRPTRQQLGAVDVVLLGGSGDYSVAQGGPWLEPALDAMRELHARSKPTFASCWGFQAMARAMGGEVVTDMARAELGTLAIHLTAAGRRDPVFAPLGPTFYAQMGHQDIVTRLPDDALLLASTDRVENQAFRFARKPIYCTQFHPELDAASMIERLRTYPEYVEKIAGVPLDTFVTECTDTPETETLLLRFLEQVVGVIDQA